MSEGARSSGISYKESLSYCKIHMVQLVLARIYMVHMLVLVETYIREFNPHLESFDFNWHPGLPHLENTFWSWFYRVCIPHQHNLAIISLNREEFLMQVGPGLDLLPSLNLNKGHVQVKNLSWLILCILVMISVVFPQLKTNKQKTLLVSLLMEVADNLSLSRRGGD